MKNHLRESRPAIDRPMDGPIPPRAIWLLAGLVAIIVCFVWCLNVYLNRAAEEQRNALSLFSQSVTLGMPRAEADRRCEQASAANSGWDYYRNLDGFGVSLALVKTPLTFGAQNWVVYIVFEENVVAAVLVRTVDTQLQRPKGSPPDRVRDAHKSWLAQFMPTPVTPIGAPPTSSPSAGAP
jgi:hypothetical protein